MKVSEFAQRSALALSLLAATPLARPSAFTLVMGYPYGYTAGAACYAGFSGGDDYDNGYRSVTGIYCGVATPSYGISWGYWSPGYAALSSGGSAYIYGSASSYGEPECDQVHWAGADAYFEKSGYGSHNQPASVPFVLTCGSS
jgi:hypothetical protein